MKVIPPDSFSRLANHCLVGQNNFTKQGFNMPVDTTSRPLQLSNQFGCIVFERALSNLTAEGTPQHHNLKGT